jgi:hypothetical protein
MRDLTTVGNELDAKRELMIKVGMRLGISHKETLRLSQKVDELHNEYMWIELRNKNIKLPNNS